jgi:hypothetical protein
MLEVIENFSHVTQDGRKRKMVRVLCDVCCQDKEMYGDGIFEQSVYDYESGKFPCGCAKIPKYTEEQWRIRITRYAASHNARFIGFASEFTGQTTKLELHCNTCGNDWNTCSAGNFMNGRKCPCCSSIQKGMKKRKPDGTLVSSFLATGVFHKDTVFTRIKGRQWKVECPLCLPDTFVSDRSNLLAGKRPCRCTNKGGFNKGMPAWVYVLTAEGFTSDLCGYGITNCLQRRYNDHARGLNNIGLTIDSFVGYPCSGEKALIVEKVIKASAPRNRHEVSGFRTEATFYDLSECISSFVANQLDQEAIVIVSDLDGKYSKYEQNYTVSVCSDTLSFYCPIN